MMRAWTVHLPAGHLPAGDAPTGHPPRDHLSRGHLSRGHSRSELVLVPERFSWFAAILPALWLLVNRLWWPLLAYLVFAAAIALLLPPAVAGFAGLAAQVLIGLHAQDLRRWKLARQGRPAAAVVLARDEPAALLRALDARPDWASAERTFPGRASADAAASGAGARAA